MDLLAESMTILERLHRDYSQLAMFADVEAKLEAIAEAQWAERFVIEARLEVLGARLDYDVIGDPRQESQYAA